MSVKIASWRSRLKLFQRKFLHPTEKNRGDLLERIKEGFSIFPTPIHPDQPYLGKLGNGHMVLEKFESIPQQPQSSDKVMKAATKILSGSLRWHAPSVLQNITPPPVIESVAISAIANLYNLNLLWDYVSAGVQEAEQQIVRQISKLNAWGAGSEGVFTYGGKGCLTYAIRIGLNRCLSQMATRGVDGRNPVVITSTYNHYIIENACTFLGLGTQACIRVETHSDETINLSNFERIVTKLVEEGRPIATIILSGGSTINLNIDPVEDVIKIIDKIVKTYKLPYKPFIYFDTVVAWPWLFYRHYDFSKNELELPQSTKEKIQTAITKLKQVEFADGMGVDFHKTGFAPYNNSAFFVKNAADLHSLAKDEPVTNKRKEFGNNFTQFHTIEHSRSAAPVLAAWVILQSVGVEGFQMYLAELTTAGDIFKKILPQFGFEFVNPHSIAYASVYFPAPPKGPQTYRDLINATPDEIAACTQYAYDLSVYLTKDTRGKQDAVDVGFLRNYLKSTCGLPHSVIRVFPMSPHMNVAHAKRLALIIGKKKLEFDKLVANKTSIVPDVVHK